LTVNILKKGKGGKSYTCAAARSRENLPRRRRHRPLHYTTSPALEHLRGPDRYWFADL